MSIRPISDLRNYPKVLDDVSYNSPVHLTKNGRGAYVIMEAAEFEQYSKEKAALRLLLELNSAESSNRLSSKEVKEHFKKRVYELQN